MRLAILTVLLAFYWPGPVRADFDVSFDGPTDWQVVVNFSALRTSPAGQPLYQVFEREFLDELERDLDLRLDRDGQVDEFWAHGTDGGFVASFDGPLAMTLRDRVERAAGGGDPVVTQRVQGNTDIYELTSEAIVHLLAEHFTGTLDIDDDDVDVFELAFPSADQVVMSTEPGLAARAVLELAGRAAISSDTFISVEVGRSLANLGRSKAPSGPWDSSVFQNIQGLQLALTESGDDLSLDIELQSDSNESAVAIQNVLNGLMGLYVLSGETDPDIDGLMRGLSVRAIDTAVEVTSKIKADDLLRLID